MGIFKFFSSSFCHVVLVLVSEVFYSNSMTKTNILNWIVTEFFFNVLKLNVIQFFIHAKVQIRFCSPNKKFKSYLRIRSINTLTHPIKIILCNTKFKLKKPIAIHKNIISLPLKNKVQ